MDASLPGGEMDASLPGGEMDASLPGGCSPQGVPLQVEALGGTGVGNNIRKQSSLGFLKLHTTSEPIVVEPKNNVEVQHADVGNSKMSIHGSTSEHPRLDGSSIFGSTVVSPFQNSHPGEHEVWKKGNGLSAKSSNGVRKDDEERNGQKNVAKDAAQVRSESQLPMRQLARKGGLSKGEAASTSKAALSVADAVKEGILKKERQEQDRRDALAAVMAVHGRRMEATGHAALFPGVTGPESGRLCQCCNRPESLKSTVFCDKCERGFHVECVKHWPNLPQELDVWHCGPCGLQPGHYWPLGRVLISYDDAVAEYQKYSSGFVTSMGSHERSNGLDGGATKVSVIRDFKKEARKGTAKGSVAIIAGQPKADHATSFTGMQAQQKTLGYPGYVPIQPKSVAPTVNFIVPPESSVGMTLPSAKAHASAKHQSKPVLEYTVSDAHTGSLSTHGTLYAKHQDSVGPHPGGSQYQNQHVSSITGPSTLSSGANQISFQPKVSAAGGSFGLEVSSIEELRPFMVGERLTEREELLREAKDSLKQLRTFISGLKGNLPEDWRVILRRRATGQQEKYYLSPAKRKYRSRQDVARYLGLVDDPRCQRIKPGNFERPVDKLLGKNDISPPAIEMRRLPLFCGDVMIEKLGVIDPRSTYSDEHHIWPIGFQSSWHDPDTGSYCISGVEDGGDLGPLFRVTRKMVIGPANSNDDLVANTSLGRIAVVVDGISEEAGKKAGSGERLLGGAKIDDSSINKLSAGGSKGDAHKQYTEGVHGDVGRHLGKQGEGHDLKHGSSHEARSKAIISDASSKDHAVTNHSLGEAVIDLTDDKESRGDVHSGIALDFRVSPAEIKSGVVPISVGNDVNSLEGLRADNHHTEPPPQVIDLSDEDDDKPSASTYRHEGPGPGVGPVYDGVAGVISGKGLGVVPPPIKPLPNILMEEFTVEARTSGGAWKLFSKQFIENCKKSLRSGNYCSVPILEATNEYVIYHSGTSNLGDSNAASALSRQESIDRKETTRALFYEKLEKRLGEDRFGLNLPEVQKMIKALGKTVGNTKAWVQGVDQIVEAARNAALLTPPIKDTAVNASGPLKRRKRKSKLDVAAEESAKKSKPTVPEPVTQQPLNLGTREHFETEHVSYRNASAVVLAVPAPAPAMGSIQSHAPITLPAPVPTPVIIVEEPRQPPPAGQPVLKRLPSELVGDLLQVWEFLCRFSDLFGHDLHCTLEDLEAGLMEVAPARAEPDVTVAGSKDLSKDLAEKEPSGAAEGSLVQSVPAGRSEPKNVIESGDKPSTADIRQEEVEVRDHGQAAEKTLQSGLTSSSSPCIRDAEQNEDCDGHSSLQGKDMLKHLNSDGVGRGLAFLADAHIPLLKFLVADLKFRVSKSLNEDDADEPKKRGRKKLCDIGALPPDLGDDLPMNAISWPEVAHRYLVAILDVKKQGEIAEIAPEQRKKLVRYFEGDGGVMGGAVDGVVGVESDAQVLAEAERELTSRMPKVVEKDIVIFVPQQWDVALTPINPAPKKSKSGKTGELPEVVPKWIEALEPVRKMPTNLGTKLKNQVQVALDLDPPEWAKATLEWSLSKGTFKSNAAGPTKRACLEVLAQYHGEELKAINAPRVRKVKAAPSAEHLMQRCRIVLREVAKADSKQVFSNLVGGAFAVRSVKDADTLSRPLDFRTIDARLAAGAYGGSTDAFAADMRQVWKNVEEVHKSGTAILELSSTLSQLFEKLYLKQVISLIKGVSETREREREKTADVDGSGKKPSSKAGSKAATDDKLGKAPWEDDTTCRVCGVDEDYDSILLCDGCDAEYHIYCLVPPLEKVPKGNWFCPSCLAVEEGFPEAPALGEAELAALQEEMERPVAGSILKLEYEDEKTPSAGLGKKPEPEMTVRLLRSATNKSDVEADDETLPEDLESQPSALESNLEAFLKELDEKEYWQISPSDKLFLLKFLCDEALKTPQVRAHLEKSVEVALELQQQLRDLIAERLKIVIPTADATNHAKSADIEKLEKSQTTTQQELSSAVSQARDGATSESQALEVAGARTVSPVPGGDEGVGVLGDSLSVMKSQGSIVGLDLDLNVEAGKEPDSEHLPADTKVLSAEKSLGNINGEESEERETRDMATGDSGVGVIHRQSSDAEKFEQNQDLKHKLSEDIEGDTSIQADAADPRPLNPLKRKFETASTDHPGSLSNGPEDLQKVMNEDTAVKSTQPDAEPHELTTVKSSDGQGTAVNVREGKDAARLTALQSARDLDVRITKLGAKLFNLSLRREHMGTDHLGREYWALTGIDGRPCLVVADMTSASQDQTSEEDLKRNDAAGLTAVHEMTTWIHYKGDKALDELVKWLSPRDQQERVLRIAIYHWRRSLSSMHLLDLPTPSDATAFTTAEPIKVVDESGAGKEVSLKEEMEASRSIQSFPSVKATRLLLKRYAAPDAAGSVLKRCECLEPIWTSRHHCQTCHETYESTAEFQTHLNNCPPGSKPNPESAAKEIQSQMPPKAKKTKKLSSFDSLPDFNQTTPKAGIASKSERSRRGLKRGNSHPAVEDDFDYEPAEPMELLSEYVESLQVPRSPEVEDTPANGLLKALEELIEPSSPKVSEQPEEHETFATNFSVDDLDATPLPEGSGKQVADPNELQKPDTSRSNLLNSQGNSGGWVNDLNIADQQFRDQELYLQQANCSSISHNGQGNNGGYVNDLNVSNQSFTDQLLESTRMNGSNSAHGNQGNSGGWANDLNVANESFREDTSQTPFGYNPLAPSTTPLQSSHNQTGFSDRGRSFAPPVQQHPLVYDSSLMIPSSPDYPSMEGFPSLDSSNPTAPQYQQLQNTLPHTPVANTNFMLSLNDTNSKHVPYNPYLSPVDSGNPPQQLSFQQLLSSPHDSLNGSSTLYPNFLPNPENVNTTPMSFSNLLHSLDTRNPQPVVYPQYNPTLENLNLNASSNLPAPSFSNLSYRNPSSVPYVSLMSNFSPPGSHHSHLNTHSNFTNLNPSSRLNLHSSPVFANSNPSAPYHASNPNPSALFTSLNPAAPSYSHFPLSNNFGEPEAKKVDVGRFNSNSWFDSQSPAEPLTVDRPAAVIPTKPTARRTSTWDYLINLPLPSSQANHERAVQREEPGNQSSPPPIEAGSLPFDLMFEKPQREDLNINSRAAPEDNLSLDPMIFEGQQMNSLRGSTRADSVTLDLMLQKQEQERGVLREATHHNEVGSLSIDLMSLPEEHIEILPADDAMGTAEEDTCMQVEPNEAIEDGAAQKNCTNDNAQVDCPEAAKESCDAGEAGADARVEDDLQVEEQGGEVEAERVEAKQPKVPASSEQRTSLPPRVPVGNASVGGRKPVKRFPVVDASVRPLEGEQKDFLRKLQISLLDMEAALATSDVLESSRALPVRRRAWRAFVKAASCIYEVTKAIILLELMVKAECLKPYWGFWSSLSAAARSSSLSSLALRLFALDGAITYERAKAPEDGIELASSSKSVKTKKKKPLDLPLPPPAKKKKKK